MSQNELNTSIKEIFLLVFPELNESDFNWEKQQSEYENWDSFAHLRIISELEKRFSTTLDLDDVVYITSATGFLNLMERKSIN